MRSILEELWYGNICPNTGCREATKEAKELLSKAYSDVRVVGDSIYVYDVDDTAEIVNFLIRRGHIVSEIKKNKIGLEEYYIELMSAKEER